MRYNLRIETLGKKIKEEAIKKLFDESTLNFDFFFLLFISAVIVTFGLLIGSPTVVIGGMLIAPVLFPILSFAMGIVVSDLKLVRRSAVNLFWSVLLIVFISFVISFFTPEKILTSEIESRAGVSLVYFLIAVFSGAAAAYALVKPRIADALPGVAISVALIPPLSVIGIAVSILRFDLAVGATGLFFMNLLGVIFAAMIVFSAFSFHDVKKTVTEKIKEEEKVIKKEEKEEQKEKIDEIAKTVKKAAKLLEETKKDV